MNTLNTLTLRHCSRVPLKEAQPPVLKGGSVSVGKIHVRLEKVLIVQSLNKRRGEAHYYNTIISKQDGSSIDRKPNTLRILLARTS